MSAIARFPKSSPPLSSLVAIEFVKEAKALVKFMPKNDKDQESVELHFFPQGY